MMSKVPIFRKSSQFYDHSALDLHNPRLESIIRTPETEVQSIERQENS
jgi:hypothetical protein